MSEAAEITLAEGKKRLLAHGQEPILSIWAAHSSDHSFDTSRINKGSMGQMAEITIGLGLSTRHIDFTDGELKTSGMIFKNEAIEPKETVAITHIGTRVDQLLGATPFQQSFLYKKLANILLVPIIQPNTQDRSSWYFGEPVHIKVQPGSNLYRALEDDYKLLCREMRSAAEQGESIHTTNGKYIQIRSKDSKPYSPIYSEKYGRELTSKGYAFYFKKNFITDVLAGKF